MNRIVIEPTIFRDVRTGYESKGFRMYDDYNQAYDNLWESIPDDDMDVLKKICKENECIEIKAMIDFIKEHHCGINIGSELYEYEQIKDYLT